MFKVLIAKKTRIEHDIKTVVKRAREYDDREESDTLAIPSSGFVFQESRCGSTLVANSLAAVDPQKHRVYGRLHTRRTGRSVIDLQMPRAFGKAVWEGLSVQPHV